MSNPVPTDGSSRAERKRARKADEATRYAGDSAGSLSFAVVALVLAGFFLRISQTNTLTGDSTGIPTALGLVLGLAGLIALGEGVRTLVNNVDRVLRARLRPPAN